jgi:hypothetical protein
MTGKSKAHSKCLFEDSMDFEEENAYQLNP